MRYRGHLVCYERRYRRNERYDRHAWSGAAATSKAVSLTLGGSAAGNYTPTGPSGSMTVTAKPITYSGLSTSSSKVYDGTTTATVSGTAALQVTEGPGNGTTSDGKP